jgi:hypothetical protein
MDYLGLHIIGERKLIFLGGIVVHIVHINAIHE